MKNYTDEIGHEGKTQKKKLKSFVKDYLEQEDIKSLYTSCSKLIPSDKNDNNTKDFTSTFTFAEKPLENMSDQPQIYNNSFDSTFNSSFISNFNNNFNNNGYIDNNNDYIDKLMKFAIEYKICYDVISEDLPKVEKLLYSHAEELMAIYDVLKQYSNNNIAFGINKEIEKANQCFVNMRQALDKFYDVNYEFMQSVHELDVSIIGSNNVQEHNED